MAGVRSEDVRVRPDERKRGTDVFLAVFDATNERGSGDELSIREFRMRALQIRESLFVALLRGVRETRFVLSWRTKDRRRRGARSRIDAVVQLLLPPGLSCFFLASSIAFFMLSLSAP
jgi:hypothetical protein